MQTERVWCREPCADGEGCGTQRWESHQRRTEAPGARSRNKAVSLGSGCLSQSPEGAAAYASVLGSALLGAGPRGLQLERVPK